MTEDKENIRVDKWLWYARFFKTRSLSSKFIASNGIRLNGKKTFKQSTLVCSGDKVTISVGNSPRMIEILKCGSRRGPASEAQLLYGEEVYPISKGNSHYDRVGERPTKKNRRLLEKIKMYSLE
jgi:ribosome-associated heat shock protein Hsp15